MPSPPEVRLATGLAQCNPCGATRALPFQPPNSTVVLEPFNTWRCMHHNIEGIRVVGRLAELQRFMPTTQMTRNGSIISVHEIADVARPRIGG